MKTKVFTFILKNKALIAMNVLGFYLFAKMAEDVIEKEYILVIDQWIDTHINAGYTPLFNQLMVSLTNLNGVVGILVFSVCVILFLAYKRWYNDLLFYMLSVLGASMAFVAVKMIVQRSRPSSDILTISTYSFPSGHATMATAIAMAVYFIFVKRVHVKSLHMFLLFICVSWIGMIAFSRVYLDVHWLSDVIAGIGLGLFWVTSIVLLKRFRHI